MTHQLQDCKDNREIQDKQQNGFAQVSNWELNIYKMHLVGLSNMSSLAWLMMPRLPAAKLCMTSMCSP